MATLTDREILEQFGFTVIEEVKDNAIEQGRTASHRAERELRQETTNSELKVIDGAGYTGWGWEDGRGPGKTPPRSKIEQWIKDKGLPVPQQRIKSVAFLIQRKIAEKGTVLYQQGGNSGVISEVVNRERIDALKQTFATKYLNEVKSEIIDEFKK